MFMTFYRGSLYFLSNTEGLDYCCHLKRFVSHILGGVGGEREAGAECYGPFR